MQNENTITHLTAINLKSRNQSKALGPLTIITGANASGKTALGDAILLGLLGQHPVMGKTGKAIMTLAPDPTAQMEVELKLGERTLRRTWTPKSSGVKSDTVGTAPSIQAAQLDFSEFIQAKPTARHEILTALMGRIDKDAIQHDITAKRQELGLTTEMVELPVNPEAKRPLGDAIENLQNLRRELKQEIDGNRKTIAAAEAEVPPPAAPTGQQLADLEAELDRKTQEVGAQEAEVDRRIAAEQRAPDRPQDPRPEPAEIEAARNHMAEIKAEEKNATAVEHQKAEIDARLTGLEAQRREQTSQMTVQPEGDKPPRSKPDELERRRNEWGQELRSLNGEIEQLSNQVGGTDASLKTLRSHLEMLTQQGTCPTCFSSGEHLKPAIEAIEATVAQKAGELQDLSDHLADAKTQRGEINETIRQLLWAEEQLKAWRLAREIERINSEIETVKKERQALGDKGDADRIRRELDQEGKRLERMMLSEREWAEFDKAAPTGPPSGEAIEKQAALKGELAEAKRRLREARERETAHAAYRQNLNRAAKLAGETEDLEHQAKNVETMRQFLLERQRAASEEAMRPLLKIAAILTDGLFSGQLARRESQLGIDRAGHFLPLEVLSGMEAVATAAACQAAMASQSDLRLILVDELGRMTPDLRARFMLNCQRAIEQGVIDQAILFDYEGRRTAPEGATVVEIETAKAEKPEKEPKADIA